jgi:hypothetical protein
MSTRVDERSAMPKHPLRLNKQNKLARAQVGMILCEFANSAMHEVIACHISIILHQKQHRFAPDVTWCVKIKQKLRFFVNCLLGSKRWVVINYAAKGFGESWKMQVIEWIKQVRVVTFMLNYHFISKVKLMR